MQSEEMSAEADTEKTEMLDEVEMAMNEMPDEMKKSIRAMPAEHVAIFAKAFKAQRDEVLAATEEIRKERDTRLDF